MRKLTGLPMAAVLALCTAFGIVGNAGFAFAYEQIPAANKKPPKEKTAPAAPAVNTAPAVPAVQNQSARKKRAPAAPMVHVGKAKKATPKPKPTKKS